MPDILEYVLGNLYAHPYLFLFIGLLAAGELVLIPGLYLAVTGRLEFPYVLGVAIAATTISDLAWYGSGRLFPAAALQRLRRRDPRHWALRLDRLYARRGAEVLFLSKFVYGTRVMAQVIAGLHAMPLRLYLVVNTLAITAVTLVLSGVAWTVAGAARLRWSP